MKYDVVIIGGGAAGLFCAIHAGRHRRRTLVVEHNPQVGRKILISGGGRCNFTNLGTGHENFISENPHFAKSSLARFTPDDFVRLVRRHRIEFYEKKLGQLFCRENARLIVDMLLAECSYSGVEIRTSCSVKHLEFDGGFKLETSSGGLSADKVVIATGGLSYPKIGASDLGYILAKQFGIERTQLRPSLVALTAADKDMYPKLAGISIDAAVSDGKRSFHENILFTHRGMSGPAILQISNYWDKGRPVEIDLLPGRDIAAQLHKGRGRGQKLTNFLGGLLPRRFVDQFMHSQFSSQSLNTLSERDIDQIAESLQNWKVRFSDTEGYDRAEVTLGGISTKELSSQTMESKKVPGLYFIGEVVDVTGWLGGYNFQWAWASGHAAGTAV